MRHSKKLSLMAITVVALLSACTPEAVITTPSTPTAGVRFINAVPDSAGAFGVDFRFVDLVESNAQFRMAFRNAPLAAGASIGSSTVQYKPAQAGARRFTIFLSDTLTSIATTVLKDSTLTLEAGKNYTVILMGSARSGQMKLKVIDESTLADPGSKVALRVINLTANPIDVRQYVTGGTAPGSPTWASVAAYSNSNFVTVDTGSYNYNVQPAGGGANVFNDLTALLGAVATSSAGSGGKLDIAPVPGTRVSGSAVSLIVFPPSTVGARTPQLAAYLVPAGSFVWDRRPPTPF